SRWPSSRSAPRRRAVCSAIRSPSRSCADRPCILPTAPPSSPSTPRSCCASRTTPTSSASTRISSPICDRRRGYCGKRWLDPALFLFREPAAHQRLERVDDLGRLPSARFDGDGGAGPGRQHHQPHDRGAADDLVTALHLHLGIEFFHRLHEFRRGARVQALLVADFEYADDQRRVRGMIGGRDASHAGGLAHVPVRTRLAMVMYLRPDSWAAATASVSGHSSRTLASFTSMGRLMPARTSTFGRPITEIARLEGVPPNISVRMATPSPLSTRLTASMMSLRRCSTSSSRPMVTASIFCCGPTTCSRA